MKLLPELTWRWKPFGFALAVLWFASPAQVQIKRAEGARAPETGTGVVGERQTREQAAPNAEPLRRIPNRIQNRVQNRLRTRIDRNFDPQVNAASPFETADDQVRRSTRSGPR